MSFISIYRLYVIIYYSKALYNVPVVNKSMAIQSVLFGQYGMSMSWDTVCHHSCKDTQSPPDTHCPRTGGFNIYTVLGLRISAWTLSIRYRGSGGILGVLRIPLYLILTVHAKILSPRTVYMLKPFVLGQCVSGGLCVSLQIWWHTASQDMDTPYCLNRTLCIAIDLFTTGTLYNALQKYIMTIQSINRYEWHGKEIRCRQASPRSTVAKEAGIRYKPWVRILVWVQIIFYNIIRKQIYVQSSWIIYVLQPNFQNLTKSKHTSWSLSNQYIEMHCKHRCLSFVHTGKLLTDSHDWFWWASLPE